MSIREISSGTVFDLELPLAGVAEGRAMDERRAIKGMLRV